MKRSLLLATCAWLGAACSTVHVAGDGGTDEPPGDSGASASDDAGGPAPVDAAADDVDAGPAPSEPTEPTEGIPCGGSTCDAGTEFCVACPRHDPDTGEEVREARCEPTAPEGWPFAGDHRCGFPGAFVECDGPEDCPEGEACTFDGGEWGYGTCRPRAEAIGLLACRSDADCDGAEGRCGEVDPFGYFSALHDLLGWRPRACGGASDQASGTCDFIEDRCAARFEPGEYARGACLERGDAWTDDDLLCLALRLEYGECEAALSDEPCGS